MFLGHVQAIISMRQGQGCHYRWWIRRVYRFWEGCLESTWINSLPPLPNIPTGNIPIQTSKRPLSVIGTPFSSDSSGLAMLFVTLINEPPFGYKLGDSELYSSHWKNHCTISSISLYTVRMTAVVIPCTAWFKRAAQETLPPTDLPNFCQRPPDSPVHSWSSA